MKKVLFSICLLAIGIYADHCLSYKCSTVTQIFNPGNVYFYKFDSLYQIKKYPNNRMEIEESKGKVTGTAKIFANGDCSFTLQLDKVLVSSPMDNFEKSLGNRELPVIFGFSDDGNIDPQICVDNSDSEYSLNLKRSILSLLNSGEQKFETDIFGVCPSEKSSMLEKKITLKDLKKCTHRENFNMNKAVVNEISGIHTLPLLYSSYIRETELKDNLTIKNVNLRESYSFLEQKNKFVEIKVTTNLKFDKSMEEISPKLVNGRLSSIIFEVPRLNNVKNFDALKKQFKKTIETFDDFVKFGSTENVMDLLRLMRHSSTDSLLDLATDAVEGLARKIYLDALFRTGTSSALSVILKQIPKMNEQEKKIAYISFYLIEDVTKENINQALELLTTSATKESYLAMGHLLSRICLRKSFVCNETYLSRITKKFIDNLKKCKAQTKDDEDKIIFILKGIKNSQKMSSSIVSALQQCSQVGSQRVRVAALQAFSSGSCHTDLKERALSLLQNINEDSEIRIESYLALLNCPSAELASKIEKLVNNEPTNQVGTFISSHLLALKKSNHKSQEFQKYYMQNIRISKKFDIDWRRFSFATSDSFLINSLGLDMSSDSYIIYGLDGYLPRSMRWNLTTQIFGREINMMDLSIRQENIEELIEKVLISKNKTRNKRGLKEEAEKFSKKYKTRNSDPALDISLKIFGSEMFFLSLDDFKNINLNNIFLEKKIEFRSLFLDTRIIYPTGLGFPMELSAQGMSANKILFDYVKNYNKWFIKLIPSFEILLSSSISIDFQAFKNGIKIRSVAQSSTGVDAELSIDKNMIENISTLVSKMNDLFGNLPNTISKRSTNIESTDKFFLTLNIPHSSLNLLKMKHNIYFTHLLPEKEEKNIQLKQKNKPNDKEQCFEQLQIFGAKLCYKADLSDFVFAEVSATLSLEKKLTFVGSYVDDSNQQKLILVYDTPDSEHQHTTKLTVSFGFTPITFIRTELELSNINKLYAMELGLSSNENDSNIFFKLLDNSQITIYKAGFTKSGNEYRPYLALEANGKQENSIAGYRVLGNIMVNNDVYSLDNIKLLTPNSELCNFDGKVTVNKEMILADIRLNKEIPIKFNVDIGGNPLYKLGLYINNNGAEIAFANSQVAILVKNGDTNIKIQGKFNKAEINTHVEWMNKNLKYLEIIFSGKKSADISELKVTIEKSVGRTAGFTILLSNVDFKVRAYFNRHSLELKGKRIGNKLNIHFKTTSGLDIAINGVMNEKLRIIDHFMDLQGRIKINHEASELQWHLKSSSNNEKYLTDGGVTQNSIQLLSWNGEIYKASERITNLKGDIVIQDIINASIMFKFNPKTGEGESTILINDKVKISTKFINLLPKFDLETSLNFGSEKKYLIKTENVLDKNNFSSKNYASSKGKEVNFDITGFNKNNETHSEINLSLPGNNFTVEFISKLIENKAFTHFLIRDKKNVVNAFVRFDKFIQNKKIMIGSDSTNLKFDCNFEKKDNIYSYDFKSGDFHSFALLSIQKIVFKLNDFQIDAEHENNKLSISSKNKNAFWNSSISVLNENIKYEHECSIENIKFVVMSFDFTKRGQRALLNMNGQEFSIDLKHDDKYMEINILTPTKKSKFLSKGNIEVDKKKGTWLIKVDNLFDFSGKLLGNFDMEDIKKLKVSLDIEVNTKLVYELDISSKAEEIFIDIKSENSEIVKGSFNYATNKELHKSYIEGQGALIVGQKVNQANFKIMEEHFVTNIDGESGIKFSFTGNFDGRTTINFLKYSDRELHGRFCLCDEKKECANIELESREGKLLAIIDLKTFGVPYEFDFKSNYKEELIYDARLIDRNNKDVYKISSVVSSLSQKIFLKVNSKELAIQASTKLPEQGLYGYYEELIEIVFDKEEKIKVLFTANLANYLFKLNWELMHPSIKTLHVSAEILGNIKDRYINGTIICDIFNKKDKELFIIFDMKDFSDLSGSIQSKGLNINRQLIIVKSSLMETSLILQDKDFEMISFKVNGSNENLVFKMKLLNSDIISITSEKKPGNLKILASILGGKDSTIEFIKNEKYLKANWNLNGVAMSEAIIVPGKKIEIQFSEHGGNVFVETISLEKNKLLEISKEGDIDQLKKILIAIKKDLVDTLNSSGDKLMKSGNHIDQLLSEDYQLVANSLTDLVPLKAYTEKKIKDISNEIEQEFGYFGSYLLELKTKVMLTVESVIALCKEIKNIFKEFNNLLRKVFNEKFTEAIKTLIDTSIDFVEVFFLESIKKIYSIDFSKYMKLALPAIETLLDYITFINDELENLLKEYENLLNTIPSYDEILNKINEIIIDFKSSQFSELLYNVLLQIKSLSPESADFCDKLYSYLKQKMHGEKVDDFKTLSELIDMLRRLFSHKYLWIENILPQLELISVPRISFSAIALMKKFPILHDFRLVGHILPMGGLITFDGNFLTYNKNCKLILVQGIMNVNFTIFGNFQNGQLKSISLVENESTIELMGNGIAKLNGKNIKWPIISPAYFIGLKEWNKFTISGIESGVEINCFNNLKHCHITISYLYTGKIRGILGNGNGEVFDDLMLPNGNIADDEDKFIATYGLGSCESWSPKNSDSCQHMFSWNSTMSIAFPFISTSAFKKACNLVSKCDVAFSYVSAAQLKNIPAILPPECLICEDKTNFGEVLSVKVPINKADVIFVIDLDISTQVVHDLIVPTLSEIQRDLKDRSFDDINIGVVGYTHKYPEPIILSEEIEKILMKERDKKYMEQLLPDISPRYDEKAFELAMRYPFRALATKTIIVIRSDGLVLNVGNLGRAIVYSAAAEMRGILLQVVQPVDGLADDVIGFNSKLTVPIKGPKDSKRRANLKYTPNVSIENVLQSGGWVFDYNKFVKLTNVSDKKSYVHQLTSSIAENLFRTEIAGNCKCLSFDGLTGTNSCLVSKSVNISKKIRVKGRR